MNELSLAVELAQSLTRDAALVELFSLLIQKTQEGHLCLDLTQLPAEEKNRFLHLLDQVPPSLLHKASTSKDCKQAKPLYLLNNRLYLHKAYRAETNFKQALIHFHHSFSHEPDAPFEEDPTLLKHQNEAVRKALQAGMLILTGGPGTGKTYTAAKIAAHCVKQSRYPTPRVILSAPTAKAVDQLKKSFKHHANDFEIISGTLHSLLDYRRKGPAYLNASCIIIDECSMIEAGLFSKLFQSLAGGVKLILMGDPAQLPPVGLGSFFQDLLALKPFLPFLHHVQLTETKRFSDPYLFTLASIALSGDSIRFFKALENPSKSLTQIQRPLKSFDTHFFTTLVDFFKQELFYTDDLKILDNKPLNSIILSTLRQGPLGVDRINQLLTDYFFTQSQTHRYFIQPMVLLESSTEIGLSNGQTGYKIFDHAQKKTCYFLDGLFYPALPFPKTSPCYALSVHKSQGSEYDQVLFMIPEGSERFSREIIYTAITRVKKNLILWLEQEPLEEAMRKKNRRESGLLQEFLAKIGS